MAELLENIPVEIKWAITAKILTTILLLRDRKNIMPLFVKSEGIIAPIMGYEKYEEIAKKIWAEGSKWFYPWVQETFNISVADAIGAAKLILVATSLTQGPEFTAEIVEESRERAVLRMTKCAWWERQKELEVDPELMARPAADQARVGEGLRQLTQR